MKLDDDDFQYWLAHMDDALEEFFETLPAHVRDRLDYSIDSLDVLEAWLLERYPNPEAALQKSETLRLDGAARYIGETFCKTIGGYWWVDPKGEIMRGMPLIIDCRTGKGGMCPVTMATASTDRRCGDFSSSILRKQLESLSGSPERPPYIVPPAKRKKNKKTLDEMEFDYWLKLMDRGIDELLAELPDAVRARLDYSPESLDVLEAWLLARYPDAASAKAETEIVRLDGVARYLGETLRKNIGGHWWFDLDGWTHDGLPQLGGLGEEQASVCPLALVHEAVEQRSKDVLGAVLRRHGGSAART
jgi:truncated hemoglobin YjbI